MEYFWLILTGLTAGWLAGQLMIGQGFGVIGDLMAGVVGALTGGAFFEMSGVFSGNGFIEGLIVATTGAVACLYGVRMLKKWRT
jgi:uncharacterized membrane protein YeaQ/YmgE (transglycosylase-associated protein family)